MNGPLRVKEEQQKGERGGEKRESEKEDVNGRGIMVITVKS